MNKVIIILILSISRLVAFSQNEGLLSPYPEVGKPCPSFFFNDVLYCSKDRIDLQTFRGKWLVLDFWNRYCGSCIYGFPQTNELQKEFKSKVKFVLVGYTGSMYNPISGPDNETIKKIFETTKKKQKLRLSIAY